MSTVRAVPRSILVIRWVARICALAVVAFVAVFLIGEGAPNPWKLSPVENLMLLSFTILLVGQLVGWVSEVAGAFMIICGTIAFYLVNLVAAGHWPRGPYFLLLAVPGFLYALCYFRLNRLPTQPSPAPTASDLLPKDPQKD